MFRPHFPALILLLLPLLPLAAPVWVADPFEPPEHSVSAGGTAGLVCRSEYQGGLHAGSYLDGLCHIDYGGADLAQTTFEVLVEEDMESIRWVAASKGEAPADAFPTGAEPWPSEAPDLIQYSCRSDVWVPDSSNGKVEWTNAGVRLGKLIGAFCNIPMGDRVVSAPGYEVLVIDGATSRIRSRPKARIGARTGRRFSVDGRRRPPGLRIRG